MGRYPSFHISILIAEGLLMKGNVPFIRARKIGLVGGSLKDVQYLLGHSWISSTQRYLKENEDAQKQVVNIINQNGK